MSNTMSSGERVERKLDRSGVWALADQIVVSGVNFLTAVVLVRSLGTPEFGRFSLIWLILLFCLGFQLATLSASIFTLTPLEEGSARRVYLGASAIQMVVYAAFCSFATTAILWFGGPIFGRVETRDLALAAGGCAFFFLAQDFIRRYFYAVGQTTLAFANDCVSYLGQIVLLAFLWRSGLLTVNRALVVIGFTSAIAILIAMPLMRVERPDRPAFTAALKTNYDFSKWLGATSLLQWLSSNLFTLATGPLLGEAALGAFRAVQNLMGGFNVIFQSIDNVAPRAAAQALGESGTEGMISSLRRTLRFPFLATLAGMAVLAAFPRFWLSFLYGNKLEQHAGLVRWFAAIYLVTFAAIPLRIALRTLHQTRTIFVAQVCATVISFATVFPLVRLWNLAGAAAGTLIVTVTMILIYVPALRRRLRAENYVEMGRVS